jgi:hypothetical protein
MPMSIDEKMEAQLRDPKVRRQPMTMGAWADACEMLGKRFREMGERIARLERDLQQARERSIDNYRGIYARNVEYLPGQYVTDRSSLWRCHTPTTGRPKDCPDWTLVSKGG